MKAFLQTEDFKRLINSTKKFISKDENRPILQYIRLDFEASLNTIKAVALDGYHMAVERANCLEIDESFSVYIKPYLPVGVKSQITKIEVIGSNCLIDMDGRIIGYRQIEGDPFNDSQVISGAEENPILFKIAVNPQYLMDALQSSKVSGGDFKQEPVIIEYRGDIKPLFLNTKNGKRMILPCRITEQEAANERD